MRETICQTADGHAQKFQTNRRHHYHVNHALCALHSSSSRRCKSPPRSQYSTQSDHATFQINPTAGKKIRRLLVKTADLIGTLRQIFTSPTAEPHPLNRKRRVPDNFLEEIRPSPATKARVPPTPRCVYVDLGLDTLPVNTSGYEAVHKGAGGGESPELQKLLEQGYELVEWDGE